MNDETLLTYADVARRWGCSARQVKRVVARRQLEAVRYGHRSVRFRRDAVLRAEEALTVRRAA